MFVPSGSTAKGRGSFSPDGEQFPLQRKRARDGSSQNISRSGDSGCCAGQVVVDSDSDVDVNPNGLTFTPSAASISVGPFSGPESDVSVEDSSGEDDRGYVLGLSDVEWSRLHQLVIPNHLSMKTFQHAFVNGSLYKYFYRKDLYRLACELRVILESRGELRGALMLGAKGRKEVVAGVLASGLACLRPSKEVGEEVNSSTAVPNKDVAQVSVPRPTTGQNTEVMMGRGAVQDTVAPNSVTRNTLPVVVEKSRTISSPPQDRSGWRPTEAPPESAVRDPPSVADANIVEMINNLSSPFHCVLHVLGNANLCFGNLLLDFQIPAAYLEGLSSRQLRLHIVPYCLPLIPTRWPSAKDIVVAVNGTIVMSSWRRTWPDATRNVAKTLLPLDITQLTKRHTPSQKLSFSVMSKEYTSRLAFLIVRYVPIEEVLSKFTNLLCGPRDEQSDALYTMYKSIVEDEDTMEDEVQVDSPVVATKCAISQTRIVIPIRGSRCRHLQCFDCRSFLLWCHNGCYWNCPLCDSELRPKDIVVDTVLLRYMQEAGERCPQYLQLESTRKGKESAGHTENGVEPHSVVAPYRWVPRVLEGSVYDVVLDDADESNTRFRCSSNQRHSEHCGSSDERPAINKTHRDTDNSLGNPETSCPAVGKGLATHRDHTLSTPNANTENVLGTADCPIVL